MWTTRLQWSGKMWQRQMQMQSRYWCTNWCTLICQSTILESSYNHTKPHKEAQGPTQSTNQSWILEWPKYLKHCKVHYRQYVDTSVSSPFSCNLLYVIQLATAAAHTEIDAELSNSGRPTEAVHLCVVGVEVWWQTVTFDQWDEAAVYRTNRSSPSTDPCGTPRSK